MAGEALRCLGAALLAPTCPCCLVEMGWGLYGVCESCWGEVLPAEGAACLLCGVSPAPGPEGGTKTDPLCRRCRMLRLRGGGPGWCAAISFGHYHGRLRDLIHAFKYGDRPRLHRPLGRMIAGALVRRGLGEDAAASAIVPVPLSPARLAGRGYDQALLLARALARSLPASGSGRAGVIRALRRVREGPPQAGLGRMERLKSPRGAFGPGPAAEKVRGRRVLLVDDVLTTGATVEACIGALRRAGAGPVTVAVAARTPVRRARRSKLSTGGKVDID